MTRNAPKFVRGQHVIAREGARLFSTAEKEAVTLPEEYELTVLRVDGEIVTLHDEHEELRAWAYDLSAPEPAQQPGRACLLISRIAYSGEFGAAIDKSFEVDRYKVGDHYTVSVGAPGYGSVRYRVTRVDSEGLWGVVERDGSGVFTPGEVR